MIQGQGLEVRGQGFEIDPRGSSRTGMFLEDNSAGLQRRMAYLLIESVINI